MPFKTATKTAPPIPGRSRNKWNSKIFNEIGAKIINENAVHFLDNKRMPIKTSRIPTIGNT